MKDIPPLIVSSWERSQRYGLDKKKAEHDFLSHKNLLERKSEMKELLQVVTSVLDHLYFQLKQFDLIVAFNDSEGYLLGTWGNPSFSTLFEKSRDFSLGSKWTEEIKGTNAVSLSLKEKKPITIIGEQHYFQKYHMLTCSATPLYSPTGEFLGTLNIGASKNNHHEYFLPMLTMAAHACQSKLLLQTTERELVLQLQETELMVKTNLKPIISIDRDGVIKRVNQYAAQILQKPISECIGRPLEHWVENQIVGKLLTTNKGSDVELKWTDPEHGKQRWIVETILDQQQKPHRVVLSLEKTTVDQKIEPPPKKEWIQSNGLIIRCSKVQKIYRFALQVAKTNASILICGETGTGKGILAKEMHLASGRKGPFLTINCGAIPEQLVESELFGYERGAFTGARSKGHPGKFEAADGGTLFLDEIGEMSLSAQVALLKVLEEKVVTRIGSHKPIPVDVRIIAATNKDLSKEIVAGRFRQDLYYRLREIEIKLPPLRERTDLPFLIQHFKDQISEELKVEFSFDADAQKRLTRYHWPGNIREMRQVIRQAAFHALFGRDATLIIAEDLQLSEQPPAQVLSMTEMEEETITQMLEETKGNLTEAARRLGIGRTTLYRKLSQYPKLKELHRQLRRN